MATPSINSTLVARVAGALYGIELGAGQMASVISDINGSSFEALVNAVYQRDFADVALADVAHTLIVNVGLAADGIDPDLTAEATAVVLATLQAANPAHLGEAVASLLTKYSQLTGDDNFGDYATQYNTAVDDAIAYANTAGTQQRDWTLINDPVTAGTTFVPDEAIAAGASVLRLTGDMDARVDFTTHFNQITGLDLDGDGAIERNGTGEVINKFENQDPTAFDNAKSFAIVDAYPRNPMNETDITNNYTGDLYFDGTGWEADGTATDGNIFLGGLGQNIAYGGIGNDFIAAHSGDFLSGGRNADFFFFRADNLDGGILPTIDAGNTTDDTAVIGNTTQDSDWLLLEVSDDYEPYAVILETAPLTEVENLDASGNLYGFLDDIDVALGENGMVVDGENVGIGSTAQIRVTGSVSSNIIIGGYDNDQLAGGAGNDLLMGGNLNYLNNPNILNIINNGKDVLNGDGGVDSIVFEADGGTIDGGADDAATTGDTLYLTRESLGTKTAADMTTDGILRFELSNGDTDGIAQFAGFGGADKDGTSDQTNYKVATNRVTVTNMESVIATGMGAVDYKAAGTNNPDLAFNNQQNHFAYEGALDLRGTATANVLYATSGDDIIEGREGNDNLSGGDGRDDFYFQLGAATGDGVDVIHRQQDSNGDNLWDTTAAGVNLYAKDFGVGANAQEGANFLTVDFTGSDLSLPGVAVTTFQVTVDGTVFDGGTLATLSAFESVATLAAHLNAVFHAKDATVSVAADGNKVVVTKSDGGVFGTDIASGTIVAGAATNGPLQTQIAATDALDTVTPDRLIYKAYEDRSDNEGVDDDATTGSTISLGRDSYAEDLVVNFAADGTRIAEDQAYELTFKNLTTEDMVSISVNGVTYTLQVGVSVDGTHISNEDSNGANTQALIQSNFLERFEGFINSFMDDDTAAGSVFAAHAAGTSVLTLQQNAYDDGEETVFMTTPVVTLGNQSGGEKATVTQKNLSQHQVHLLNFDGTDAALNASSVLFIGQEGVANSRSVLATAADAGGELAGSEALVINGGADDLIDVAHNLATDEVLGTNKDDDAVVAAGFANGYGDEINGNFVVHGDDLLIGGSGDDEITGGTGDDRIVGSAGDDVVDGGSDLYAVRLQGQAGYAVETLNAYQAEQRDADAEVLDIYLLEQTEVEDTMIGGANFTPYFQDTLVFQQADFTVGKTEFTIDLNNYAVENNEVILEMGGAGTVSVDADGNGVSESETVFTNFEHIRTVSGTGKAVAGSGQGNDTLVLTGLSDDTDGIVYDLTNTASAGLVTAGFYDADTDTWADQDIIRVDGVENVIAGSGADTLVIDETEAAKNNLFDGGGNDVATSGGDEIMDSVEYRNDFGDADFEPTVTIVVEAESDTDEVIMTGGRVGLTVATDTLIDVEFIDLLGNTAVGVRENDTLDVTNFTDDVVVDFVNEEVRTADGDVLVTIGHMNDLEIVKTDGDDLLIVGDVDYMGLNGTSDAASAELVIDTYLNYDSLNDDVTRETVADMRANNEVINLIPEARNFEQFTFNLGQDTDRVDYSETDDQIAAIITVDSEIDYVMVNGGAADDFNDAGDRVDVLVAVEEIVASQGESILDFTSYGEDIQITFGYTLANAAVPLDGDLVESSIRIADGSGNVIGGLNAFVERYTYDDVAAGVDTTNDVTWNRVEGSDADELVKYDGSENMITQAGLDHRYSDDTLTLRGGDNGVSYTAIETSIDVDITVTEDTGAGDGLITATVDFFNGNGNAAANALVGAGTHVITSNGADNSIVGGAGTLKIEASQDAEDTVSFNTDSDKIFLMGVSAGVLNVDIGANNSMILTGFEFLQDSDTDDVYDMSDLEMVQEGLSLIDSATDDTDTIKVGDDAVAYDGGPATLTAAADTISLEVLNDVFGFDFDVLDITNVTEGTLILVGDDNDQDNDALLNDNAAEANYFGPADVNEDGNLQIADGDRYALRDLSDDVIVGDLDLIDSITGFDTIWFTDASVAAANGGDTYTLDTTAGVLESATADDIDTDSLNLNFSLATTTGVTVDVVGAGPVVLTGSAQDDSLSGSTGSDTIQGNAGDDTLSGGGAEVLNVLTMEIATDVAGTAAAVAIQFDATTWYTTVAGDGPDVIGAAMVAFFAANPAATVAGVVPESVAYDAGSNQLTVSFGEQIGDVALNTAYSDGLAASVNFLGADEISAFSLAGAGDDVIWGGAGVDDVDGGDGDDIFLVVGTIDNSDLVTPDYAVGDTAGTGAADFAEAVAAIETLGATYDVVEVTTDSFTGGDGNDTIEVWGNVDFANATIDFATIEVVDIHSTVYFTKAQLADITVLDLDADSVVVVTDATSYADAMDALNSVSLITGALPALGFGDGEGDDNAPLSDDEGDLTDAIIADLVNLSDDELQDLGDWAQADLGDMADGGLASIITNDNVGGATPVIVLTPEQMYNPATLDALGALPAGGVTVSGDLDTGLLDAGWTGVTVVGIDDTVTISGSGA